MNDKPLSTIDGRHAPSKKIMHGLDPSSASEAEISAAVNLLYRIVAGNGLLERAETIDLQHLLLRARKVGFVFEISADNTGYHLMPQPISTTEPNTHNATMVGLFMGMLRAMKPIKTVSMGNFSDKQHTTNVSIHFETKRQLVSAVNKLAEQYPEVALLSNPNKTRPAIDLIGDIAAASHSVDSPSAQR